MKIALISTDVYVFSHGLRAISTYLKKNGHEVIILSMSAIREWEWKIKNFRRRYSDEALKNMIGLVKDCGLIGVSSLAATSDRAIQIIDAVKPLNIPTIWGGIFPTTYPEYCIKHCDIICIGEGEEALCELADRIEKNRNYYNTRNFWFKRDGKTIKNPVRPLIENLDDIPPDYDPETNFVLEKNRSFVNLNSGHIRTWLFYQGTRGCHFSCKYCCNYQLKKIYNGKGSVFRKKTIRTIIKELKELKGKFELNFIWFTDDDINLFSLSELKDFSKLYKREIGLPFRTYMNPMTIDEKKLRLLLKAGLKEVEVGVQTGSDRINKEIYGRPVSGNDVLRAAKILNKYKDYMSPPSYQIMINSPYDKNEDVLHTISLLREIPPPYYLQPFGLVFFPGTPLYNKAVKDGYVKRFEDSAYDLDYYDVYKHFKIKHKNLYLNTVLEFMEGRTTRFRHGLIPRFMFGFLLKKNIIRFLDKRTGLLLSVNKIKWNFSKRVFRPSITMALLLLFNTIKLWVYRFIPQRIKEKIKSSLITFGNDEHEKKQAY